MRRIPILIATFALLTSPTSAQEQEPYQFPLGLGPNCNHNVHGNDQAIPANQPYRFMWQKFVKLNRMARIQWEVVLANGQTASTNNAVWETFAEDGFTFPSDPDPANPPQWEDRIEYLKRQDRAQPVRALHVASAGDSSDPQPIELVYRNRAAFDYIIDNGLWYTQGIAAFFKSGQEVEFPTDAIEVKGNYIPITEDQKPQYHWNYINGELYGLVASHVITKDLPNWTWATFEQWSNAGRCDFLGCRDCFGQTPVFTPSHTDKVGQTYPAETQTARLLDLYRKAGYEGAYFEAYKQYRIKGVMIDFADSTGNPNFLGNSVTEDGFVQTASCMSCHARAAVTPDGKNAFPIFGEFQGWPLSQTTPSQFGITFITPFGYPDRNWYTTFNGNGSQRLFLQTDFVWAIPFKAQPAKNP
ncbi:MAG: hypothetical protein MPN21_13475 [Thermoanaerobaculia bacterium]|nr:hypothetical protein [Thermoanaerobaculia bacterium]